PHMETPRYDIQRMRDDEVRQAGPASASYKLITEPEAPPVPGAEMKRELPEQPMVKGITPASPAPASKPVATVEAGPGLFVRLWRSLFGSGEKAVRPQPARPERNARRDHDRNRDRDRKRHSGSGARRHERPQSSQGNVARNVERDQQRNRDRDRDRTREPQRERPAPAPRPVETSAAPVRETREPATTPPPADTGSPATSQERDEANGNRERSSRGTRRGRRGGRRRRRYEGGERPAQQTERPAQDGNVTTTAPDSIEHYLADPSIPGAVQRPAARSPEPVQVAPAVTAPAYTPPPAPVSVPAATPAPTPAPVAAESTVTAPVREYRPEPAESYRQDQSQPVAPASRETASDDRVSSVSSHEPDKE
ncbi:MAG TPA: hypothetical protein VF117_04970, partial [Gammaproteobacteria bacterium]